MDGFTTAIAVLTAGTVIAGVFVWRSLPRWPEDYFEADLTELASYTASGPPYQAPLAGGSDKTAEHHQPDSGLHDVECPASPPTISSPERVCASALGKLGGAADVQSSRPAIFLAVDNK